MAKGVLTPKAVVITFFVVLLLYAGAFYGIESMRHRLGPWRVDFITDATGQPSILIRQEKLGVEDVKVSFAGERVQRTNLNETVVFDAPEKSLPFGERLHEDLLSLPGVETVNFFGHYVEILPRALRLNNREYAWGKHGEFTLTETNKIRMDPRSRQEIEAAE